MNRPLVIDRITKDHPLTGRLMKGEPEWRLMEWDRGEVICNMPWTTPVSQELDMKDIELRILAADMGAYRQLFGKQEYSFEFFLKTPVSGQPRSKITKLAQAVRAL